MGGGEILQHRIQQQKGECICCYRSKQSASEKFELAVKGLYVCSTAPDQLDFGAYVQTHEDHTNGMEPWTCGAICLGCTGNEQGGHYFMSLATGRRLIHNQSIELPMPCNAINWVGNLG